MSAFSRICRCFVGLSLLPIFSAPGGETVNELPGKALEVSTKSTGSNIWK
jgi:hypothetical protein